MLKTYLIGFGLLLLYSVACSDHGKTGKLARIDSLINEVSVLDSIIHSFDYDSIKKISIDVRTTIGCIGEHIQGVPEGDSMNLRIARFSVIAKALKRF
ncbi:MAG: hypothetical protein KJ607_04490, partial [Bacteroidetes bacterium]|nr:hypothetical protein [Bacteroidota bacterium]